MVLGLALAALLAFWALFLPKPAPPAAASTRPVSSDAGRDGYLGLVRWLEAEKVPVLAWRHRYAELNDKAAVPGAAGNVLVTTMPHKVPVSAAEMQVLDEWIGRGNTLLVMAALDDTPRWSLAQAERFESDLQRVTRLKFTVIDEGGAAGPDSAAEALEKAFEPVRASLEPVAPHALFAGVGRIATSSELPASRWKAQPMDVSPVLELAHRADTGDAAVWLKRQRSGRVIVCGFATPWSNAMLGEADNGRWLAAVLAMTLGAHGRVLLDDMHQDLGDEYNAKAFFGDPRLHRTLGWIVLLWLAYVVGVRTLRPQAPAVAAVDDTAFLATSAGFFANALAPATVGVRLCGHFFNRIRRRLGLRESGLPVWEWLESHARIEPDDLERLRRLYERADAGRSVDLAALGRLLQKLSRRLE